MPSQPANVQRPIALRARWVFPIDVPPIANGIVTIQHRRVTAVGTSTEAPSCMDLGNVALLPGLVNCHTHLEFSNFDEPLPGFGGQGLPAWIEQVVAHRRRAGEIASAVSDAIGKGLRECWDTGTAVVGEIATRSWADYACIDPSRQRQLYIIKFRELLGLGPQTVEPLCSLAREHVEQSQRYELSSLGLSPHAPYTVHPDVLRCATGISAALFVPIAMHIAESPEELELLAHHRGAMVELLQRLNAWFPESLIYRRPLDYLKQLADAHRALVVHGNYLDHSEIEFLGQQRERMSVVYCPRTHSYFGHSRYPLDAMLKAGVRVAVGTDSRASNPDLSLFEELCTIAARYPEIPPDVILKMGTSDGADALGLENDYGRIQCGSPARFAVAPLTSDVRDPYEALWSAERTRALVIG